MFESYFLVRYVVGGLILGSDLLESPVQVATKVGVVGSEVEEREKSGEEGSSRGLNSMLHRSLAQVSAYSLQVISPGIVGSVSSYPAVGKPPDRLLLAQACTSQTLRR